MNESRITDLGMLKLQNIYNQHMKTLRVKIGDFEYDLFVKEIKHQPYNGKLMVEIKLCNFELLTKEEKNESDTH
jgi:hypothetical protein